MTRPVFVAGAVLLAELVLVLEVALDLVELQLDRRRAVDLDRRARGLRGAPAVREHRPLAWRYPFDREAAIGPRDGMAAIRQHHDRRRHLRVHVAIDVDDAEIGKLAAADLALLVAAEIE